MWMAILIVTALCAGSLMWWLSEVSARRAGAQAVADLTALAAVTGDGSEQAVLSANRAALVEIRRDGATVRVVIRRDGVDATATAEPVPGEEVSGP